MRRLTACLLVGLLGAAPLGAETLRLRSGDSIEAGALGFSEGSFLLEGGRRIPRDEVSAVDFGTAAPTGKAPPDPAPKPEREKEPEVALWNREAAALEKRHPGHATTLIRDEAVQELRADGTRVNRTRLVYRVNKDAAIGYGSWSEGFDPARERVRVIRARTLLADGSVIPLDPAKTRVQDARSSSSNLTNKKILVWQLDGVRVGSYVEHVYETEVFQPFKKEFFFPRFFFQSSDPVVRTRLEVVVPAEKTLHWVGSHLDVVGVKHQEKTAAGKTTHVWQAENVAPMVREPRMPGASELTPRVAASLFDDWKSFFEWEGGNLERNITPTPAVEAKARALTAGAKDDDERVARIYRFLQEEIRYVSVKSGIGSGWSGHPAADTLENGYGDCVDKAVLMSSLLRTVGIRSEPVTIMTNDVRDMETRLPGLDANHCISQVHLGGRSFFLDSTTTNYRYPYFRSDDHGQPASNPLRGEIVRVPFPPPERNEARRLFKVRLEKDGSMTMEDEWSGNGSREARQRGFWKRQKKQDYAKIFRDHYSSLAPGARIMDFEVGDPTDFSRPLVYRARFTARDYGSRAGKLMIVKIPFFELSFSETSLVERKYPIDYRTTARSTMRWEITLPDGFRVKAHPEDVRLETKSGSFELRSRTEKGVFVIDRVLTTSKPYVKVEEFPLHRAILKKLESLGREQLFLEEAS